MAKWKGQASIQLAPTPHDLCLSIHDGGIPVISTIVSWKSIKVKIYSWDCLECSRTLCSCRLDCSLQVAQRRQKWFHCQSLLLTLLDWHGSDWNVPNSVFHWYCKLRVASGKHDTHEKRKNFEIAQVCWSIYLQCDSSHNLAWYSRKGGIYRLCLYSDQSRRLSYPTFHGYTKRLSNKSWARNFSLLRGLLHKLCTI